MSKNPWRRRPCASQRSTWRLRHWRIPGMCLKWLAGVTRCKLVMHEVFACSVCYLHAQRICLVHMPCDLFGIGESTRAKIGRSDSKAYQWQFIDNSAILKSDPSLTFYNSVKKSEYRTSIPLLGFNQIWRMVPFLHTLKSEETILNILLYLIFMFCNSDIAKQLWKCTFSLTVCFKCNILAY